MFLFCCYCKFMDNHTGHICVSDTHLRTFLWGLLGSLWYGTMRGWKSSSPASSLDTLWASPLPMKTLPFPSSSPQESSASPCVQDTMRRLRLHPRDSPRIRGKAGLNRARNEERRIPGSWASLMTGIIKIYIFLKNNDNAASQENVYQLCRVQGNLRKKVKSSVVVLYV